MSGVHTHGKVYVSDTHKFVYVLVPKAGSTTARIVAERYGGVEKTWHELSQEQLRYFKFAFVRDPWSRLKAAHRTLITRIKDDCVASSEQAQKKGEWKNKNEGLSKEWGTNLWVLPDSELVSLCDAMFTKGSGFQRFVQKLNSTGVDFDEHLREQVWFLSLNSGAPMPIDLIADFKDQHAVWNWVYRALKFERYGSRKIDERMSIVMHKGMGAQEAKDLKIRYNESDSEQKLRSVASNLYRRDYCCFGY